MDVMSNELENLELPQLVDKLEELEDVEDLKKIRCEPSRPLEDVLRDLGLDE